MKTISIRDLRQKWPEAESRLQVEKEIIITRDAKPVAKLVPADKNTDDIYNFLAGKGAITGDIISPALSEENWGELK